MVRNPCNRNGISLSLSSCEFQKLTVTIPYCLLPLGGAFRLVKRKTFAFPSVLMCLEPSNTFRCSSSFQTHFYSLCLVYSPSNYRNHLIISNCHVPIHHFSIVDNDKHWFLFCVLNSFGVLAHTYLSCEG